jgi:hypothetical protein
LDKAARVYFEKRCKNLDKGGKMEILENFFHFCSSIISFIRWRASFLSVLDNGVVAEEDPRDEDETDDRLDADAHGDSDHQAVRKNIFWIIFFFVHFLIST